MINVKYYPCLFEENFFEFDTHNITPISILISLIQKFPEIKNDEGGISFRVNGRKISPFEWKTSLKDGDRVLIIQEVGIVDWIFAIGLTLAGLGLGTGVTAATAAVISTVITVAFTIASLAYSIYSMCSSPKPDLGGKGLNNSPTYGWEGLQMQVRQGVPVPLVYGEHLVAGNLIEAYISSADDKNYLNLLIALSEGEIEGIMKQDLSGICTLPSDIPYVLVNDNLFGNLKGISWDWRPGTQDQTKIPGFGDICQVYNIGAKLEIGSPYYYTTIDSDVEGFELRFRNPALFAQFRGNYWAVNIIISIKHRVHGHVDWIDDGNMGYWGDQQTAVRKFFRKDGLTPEQYDIMITNISTYSSGSGIQADLYLDNITEIKYDVLTYPHTALLALKIQATDQLNGQIPNVLTRIRGIKVSNLDTGITEWTQNPIYCVNNILTNSRYGAGNFITQANINNDQLIEMANHCDEILGDGVKRTIDSFTSTSLTCLTYDFTDVDIGKYICSKSSTDEAIYTMLQITSRNGDHIAIGSAGWTEDVPVSGGTWEFGEKRYLLDLVIDSENPALSAITQACGSFRGSPLWNKDAVQIIIDKKETPSYLFNIGNVIEGSFKHTFGSEKSKPNSIMIDYANKDKRYQKDSVDVTDFTAITGGLPKRRRTLSLLGATRSSQIYREGRYHLYAAKFQDEQISFRAAIDAIHLMPGEVFKFQTDILQWGYGGRIISATTTSVTLDQSVELADGATYVIMCKLADDTLETKTITNAAGIHTIITISGSFTSAPLPYGLYTIGKTGTEAKDFRVVSISKTPENEVDVVATEYSDSVYSDTDIILVSSVFSGLPDPYTWPVDPIPPDGLAVPSDVSGLTLTEDMTSCRTGITISFVRPEPSATETWAYAMIYISDDEGLTYRSIATVLDDNNYIYYDVRIGVNYHVKIVSYSAANVPSAAPPVNEITITGLAPSTVTGLAVTDESLYIDPTTGITLASVKVEWDNNADTENIDVYEILWNG